MSQHLEINQQTKPGAALIITALAFEHQREPVGIGEERPRLSWLVGPAGRGLAASRV